MANVFVRIISTADNSGFRNAISGLSKLTLRLAAVGAAAKVAAAGILPLSAALVGLAAIGGAGFAAIKLGMDGIKKAAQGAEPALTALKAAVSSGFESSMAAGFSKVSELLTAITPQMTGLATTIGTSFSAVMTGISDQAFTQIQAIVTNAQTFIAGITPGLTALSVGFITFAATASGVIAQVAPQINQWLTEIGTKLGSITAQDITTKFNELRDTFNSIRDAVMTVLPIIQTMIEHWQIMFGLFVALKAIQIGTAIIQFGVALAGILPALGGVIAATWAWTAALLANPITWVVLAIAALIAIIAVLIANWDTVKAVAGQCWDWIRSKAEQFWNWLGGIFAPVLNAISSAFDATRGAATAVWDAVSGAIQTVIGWIQSLINWISNIHWPSPPSWLSAMFEGSPLLAIPGQAAFMTPTWALQNPGTLHLASDFPSLAALGGTARGNVIINNDNRQTIKVDGSGIVDPQFVAGAVAAATGRNTRTRGLGPVVRLG